VIYVDIDVEIVPSMVNRFDTILYEMLWLQYWPVGRLFSLFVTVQVLSAHSNCVLDSKGRLKLLRSFNVIQTFKPSGDFWFMFYFQYSYSTWAAIAQSVLRLATGWTVQGSNPCGGRFFCTRPDWPWGPPSLLYNGYWVSFPRVKRPGRGIDHLPPSCAKVKERVELYLCSPSVPSWPVIGWNYLYLYTYFISCRNQIYILYWKEILVLLRVLLGLVRDRH
jgi:hypothetical protein